MSTPPSQVWLADRYARNARFVADLAAPLVDLLAPRPDERILDLGCGDGALTERIAAAGAIVVGVDGGPDMVAAARARGLDARVMDGQSLTFEAEFDAVFSNAALHWMPRADAVLDGVRRALRPGGRFVAEFGGGANVASILEALTVVLARRGVDAGALVPWYFPTLEDYRDRLAAHDFQVDSIALTPRPTPLPGPLEDWLETFGEVFLTAVPAGDREAVKVEVASYLAPRLRNRRGEWTLDYERLRFVARLFGSSDA